MPDAQRTIEQQAAQNRRGQQLLDRRKARFGGIYRRMLLWLLDDRIGSGQSWEMTFAQLADDCEMSLSKTYAAAAELRQMSLIDYREVEPNSGRYEFRIIRSNVSELAEQSGQVPRRPRGRPQKTGHDDAEKSSTRWKTLPPQGKPFHTVENPSTTGKTFPHGGKAPYIERPLTTTTPPPTAAKASWVMVEGELLDVGIQETEKPLSKMRETGCAPAAALQILEFWKSQPGRWSEGKLRRRLINLRPGQAADDLRFWPPADRAVIASDPEWDAGQIRELIEWVLSQDLNASQRSAWLEILNDERIEDPHASGFLVNYRDPIRSAFKWRSDSKELVKGTR